jgi:hypothetical protein
MFVALDDVITTKRRCKRGALSRNDEIAAGTSIVDVGFNNWASDTGYE